jgi:hypothetical protein
MRSLRTFLCTASLGLLALLAACGDDDPKADRLGVGAQCTSTDQCDEETNQQCLAFKGGYCGIQGCTGDADCPEASACIAHTDGMNYCFRTCVEKVDCNANRDADNEANCSSSVTFVDDTMGRKACVPPSST